MSLGRLGETGLFSEEFQIVCPDGTVRWVWAQGFPVRDPKGRIYRFVGTVQDITDRRGAEAALKESEDRYRDRPIPWPRPSFSWKTMRWSVNSPASC